MSLSTYTASAGSGKTYALTRDYLQTLLSKPSAIKAYKQLLAITFTNKAADEMKVRIMERLNSMACSTDINSAADEKEFCRQLSITPEELRKRALALRSAILHDYSHFSISTIDAFFQKIVRSFLREMGLAPDFNLELDSERILDKAVDAVWQDAATDEPLRHRLTALINQRINNGLSWNARDQLKGIGYEVFKETFRNLGSEFMAKIGDTQFLKDYEKELQTIVANFSKTMRESGLQALSVLKENNLSITDLKYKAASFANYFAKIAHAKTDKDYTPGARAYEALGNEEKWLTGDREKDRTIQSIIFPTVNPLLEKALICYKEQFTTYRTAREILKNLYSMALLADVANKVTAISSDENLLLIGDTLYLLHALIGDNDTPFVYEKAGISYNSFMLDEFQDTSNMQWESLRPLLLNGLAEGGTVLAVGDVKQSIYRWRNGDWQILAHGLYDYFNAYDVEKIILDTNWRSNEVIVNTNNMVFEQLPALLQQKLNEKMSEAILPLDERTVKLRNIITDAYSSTIQKVSPRKSESGGYVQIESIAADADEEYSAKEKVLSHLIELITDLQDRGYRASDIALLVRYQSDGQEVADALLQHKQTSGDTTHCFDILSQDSLFLVHAPIVQFVIALLQVAVDSGNTISLSVANRYLEQYLPTKKITGNFLDELLFSPLAEAIEKITEQFGLNENSVNWAFLQELHDVMLSYVNREHNDIFNFLQHWKETGEKYTLSMAGNCNALQILTIHKSKGLEFPVVIIPFCNWNIEPKTNSLIWVKAEQEPFSGPGYLPLNYSNTLAETFFSADYWEEQAQSAIDNLNLLYVAFTRAEKELYAFIPQPKQKKNNSFAVILPELLQSEKYTVGTPSVPVEYSENKTSSFTLNAYPSLSYANRLRTKYSDQKPTDITATGIRDYGILMHRAFSYITTLNDVDAAVSKLVELEFLSSDSAQRELLSDMLTQALKQPGAQEWFDGSWQLLIEADLLLPTAAGESTHRLRPDRVLFRNGEVVVVDYKFGEKKQEQYTKQIQSYILAIKKMGYNNVKGYCWYISLEQIESVYL